MNEKILDFAHYSYIVQIVNIHKFKQAKLTRNNDPDLTVPLFIEENSNGPNDMEPSIFA